MLESSVLCKTWFPLIYDNHLFDITVCIYIMSTSITVYPARMSSWVYSNCTVKTAYEPECADLVGRKPGWSKWTTMLSQTETSDVPCLATKWLRNKLQVAKGQSTTAKQLLGQAWRPMTHFGTVVVELKSKSNTETIATNQTQKQNIYVIPWHCFFFFPTSLLEYNCFTMVGYFLLYNKVNQLYVYIYPHISSLLRLPPTLPIPPL